MIQTEAVTTIAGIRRIPENPCRVEIHMLIPFANSSFCKNENGGHKVSDIGGTKRKRISSQCLKAPIRSKFDPAIRTQYPGLVWKSMLDKDDETRDAIGEEGCEQLEGVFENIFKTKKQQEGDSGEDKKKNADGKKSKKSQKSEEPQDKEDLEDDKPTENYVTEDEPGKDIEKFHLDNIQVFSLDGMAAGYDAVVKAFVAFDKKERSTAAKEKLPELQEVANKAMNGRDRLCKDIAMFGRMVTANIGEQIESACSFAHAFGIAEDKGDVDLYAARETGFPDAHRGAATLGSREIFSTTMYEYCGIDVAAYMNNMYRGGVTEEELKQVCEDILDFVDLTCSTRPDVMQAQMASHPLPAAILVTVTGEAEQMVDASSRFEHAVEATETESIAEIGALRLTKFAADIKENVRSDHKKKYLVLFGDVRDYVEKNVSGLDLSDVEFITYKDLFAKLGGDINAALGI